MHIIFKGKNIDLTEALKSYTTKRFGKVEKFFDNVVSAEVTLSTERNWHIAEITVNLDGLILRGEDKTNDMYATIDKVIEKLEKQLKRHKEKIIKKSRRDTKEEETTVTAGKETPNIVLMKKVIYKPMAPEDAIEQLEKDEYDFYVFFNIERERINVIFKRDEGNYGLIDPEIT